MCPHHRFSPSSSFFLFLTAPPPPPPLSSSPLPLHPPCQDKIADYTSCPFLYPASAPMPLPAAPYSTHYATLDYNTNFRLSLVLSPRHRFLVFLSPAHTIFPSLFLRTSVSFASTHAPFIVSFPPATSSVSLVRLHRELHDRHSANVLHERVYAEYYARSDSLTQQCRTNVPARAPGVNHLVKLPRRDSGSLCLAASTVLREKSQTTNWYYVLISDLFVFFNDASIK